MCALPITPTTSSVTQNQKKQDQNLIVQSPNTCILTPMGRIERVMIQNLLMINALFDPSFQNQPETKPMMILLARNIENLINQMPDDFDDEGNTTTSKVIAKINSDHRETVRKIFADMGASNTEELREKQQALAKAKKNATAKYLKNPETIKTRKKIALALVESHFLKISKKQAQTIDDFWNLIRSDEAHYEIYESMLQLAYQCTLNSIFKEVDSIVPTLTLNTGQIKKFSFSRLLKKIFQNADNLFKQDQKVKENQLIAHYTRLETSLQIPSIIKRALASKIQNMPNATEIFYEKISLTQHDCKILEILQLSESFSASKHPMEKNMRIYLDPIPVLSSSKDLETYFVNQFISHDRLTLRILENKTGLSVIRHHISE